MRLLKIAIYNSLIAKIIFAVVAILLGPLLVFATAPLVITEIMFNPSGDDTGREWVEIYNFSSSTPINLGSAWRFNDGANHLLGVKQGSADLNPGQLAIITASSTAFQLSYPNYSGTIFQSAMSLGNLMGSLSLFDGTNYLASTTYQIGSINNFQEGYSIELPDILQPSNWLASVNVGGAPGQFYQAPSSTPTTTPVNLAPILEVIWPDSAKVDQDLDFVASSTDPEGQLVQITWDFPDKTVTASQTIYAFKNFGTQKVTVTASDGQMATGTEKTFQVVNKDVVTTDSNINVVINEILPNPTGDDASGEWIEIFNRGLETVDLTNWQVKDGTTRRYTITEAGFTNSTISPGGYFVVSRNISGVVLNNDNDEVYLYRPGNIQVDKIIYSGGVVEGSSLARSGDSWQWTTTPTRGNTNIFTQINVINDSDQEATLAVVNAPVTIVNSNPVPSLATTTQDFSDLRINEFLPNPGKDNNEWIELYNASSTAINLFGLSLDDEIGGSKPFAFLASTTLPGFSYQVFYKNDTKLNLNNNHDEIRLLKGKEVLQGVSYDKAPLGQVFVFDQFNDEWSWSDNPTPGANNNFTSQELIKNILKDQATASVATTSEIMEDFSDLDQVKVGDKVIIRGAVVAVAGPIGKNKLVLSALDGDQLQFDKNILVSSVVNIGKIKLGQIINLAGTVKVNKDNLKYILANKKIPWLITGQVKLDLAPEIISTIDANDFETYSLVTINGKVLDKKGAKLILDDGNGELIVSIPTSLKELLKDIKKGDDYQITGVILKTADQVKLVPRDAKDLLKQQVLGTKEDLSFNLATSTITATSTDERTGVFKYLLYSLAGVIAAAGSVIVKLKFWS